MQIKHHLTIAYKKLCILRPSQSVRRQIEHLDDADDYKGDGRQALQGRGNNEVQTEGVPRIIISAWAIMDFMGTNKILQDILLIGRMDLEIIMDHPNII